MPMSDCDGFDYSKQYRLKFKIISIRVSLYLRAVGGPLPPCEDMGPEAAKFATWGANAQASQQDAFNMDVSFAS